MVNKHRRCTDEQNRCAVLCLGFGANLNPSLLLRYMRHYARQVMNQSQSPDTSQATIVAELDSGNKAKEERASLMATRCTSRQQAAEILQEGVLMDLNFLQNAWPPELAYTEVVVLTTNLASGKVEHIAVYNPMERGSRSDQMVLLLDVGHYTLVKRVGGGSIDDCCQTASEKNIPVSKLRVRVNSYTLALTSFSLVSYPLRVVLKESLSPVTLPPFFIPVPGAGAHGLRGNGRGGF